ncbi:MAG: glycosyltransferase family 2 protein [Gemmataceae bacterium]
MIVLAGVALTLAAVPALLYLANLAQYRTPPLPGPETVLPAVSVLIPARNEEAVIETAVRSALTNRGVTLEVVVLDDHSSDRTAAIVHALAAEDPRVRLESAPELPPGWCGKQHACHVLASRAQHPLLLFIDADVRLEPEGIARLVGFLLSSGADLVSGIPRQQTGTLLEKLLIPLIHFILLGFLPIARMRTDPLPALGAGCGQLFLARAEAYQQMGGHAVIRTSLHDGVKLPRAFRMAGKKTDLCDATALASCRMYRNAAEVWFGLAKNATEGLAAPAMIVPATLLLGLGQVLPFVLLGLAGMGLGELGPWTIGLSVVAALLAMVPRLAGVYRFRQSLLGAVLHPLGISLLLAIQWYALLRRLSGGSSSWKGRSYTASPAS